MQHIASAEPLLKMTMDYTYSGWSDRWITSVLHTSHALTWNLMLYDGGDLKLLQLGLKVYTYSKSHMQADVMCWYVYGAPTSLCTRHLILQNILQNKLKKYYQTQ